jgi:CheY-like chemotaxis protein
VLLAEDNVVNQRVAVRLLEKRGCAVTVAGTGREALAALAQERFDLVLMDVQMPEMDGLEATAEIRAREELTGEHIPIIAITAHAMNGDRERCLEGGMDGYVAKPIEAPALFVAIGDVLGSSCARISVEASDVRDPNSCVVFDRTAALARVEGDVELLCQLASLFLDHYPEMLVAIRDAIGRGDSQAVERSAHILKGSAGNLAAVAVCRAAERLEQMGQTGDLTRAKIECDRLQAELDSLMPMLAAISTEEAP